jgi:hypothetical protein
MERRSTRSPSMAESRASGRSSGTRNSALDPTPSSCRKQRPPTNPFDSFPPLPGESVGGAGPGWWSKSQGRSCRGAAAPKRSWTRGGHISRKVGSQGRDGARAAQHGGRVLKEGTLRWKKEERKRSRDGLIDERGTVNCKLVGE